MKYSDYILNCANKKAKFDYSWLSEKEKKKTSIAQITVDTFMKHVDFLYRQKRIRPVK
jgi:hypothetical protein